MAMKIHHQCFLLIFSISLLSLFFPIINAKLNLHPSDLKALSTLQNQNNLKVKVNPCNTEGVFCERRKLSINETTYVLRITKLVFTSKNLKAKLSPTISLLTELKELSLSNNKFVDQIPPSIVDCRKLEILNLSNNLFSGEVPSQLSSLVRLRFLDLSSNKLSGNLNFLRYFPNLETLSVADNLFTGRVPNSVRSFRNLRHFNFSGNRFLESSLQYELTDSDASSKRHREGNSCSGLTRVAVTMILVSAYCFLCPVGMSGIGKKCVVAVLAPNVPAMYELHFGVPMSGAILCSMNTSLEVAVVGRPDNYLGETPCAFVKLKDECSVTPEEIIQFCRDRLPSYMAPTGV